MSFLRRTVTLANGTTTQFAVSFPLPEETGRDGVLVYVYDQGALTIGSPKTSGVDYTWLSDGLINYSSVLPNGKVVDIRSATQDTALLNQIPAGGSIRTEELAQNDQQLLDLIEECIDEDAYLLSLIQSQDASLRAYIVQAVAAQLLDDLKGNPGSAGEGYGTLAAVEAALGGMTNLDDFYLNEGRKRGKFIFYTAAGYNTAFGRTLTDDVALSPTQGGLFITPSGDSSGASGAAMRSGPKLTPFMWGAKGDGATNDLVALQAFNDEFCATIWPGFEADWTGSFGISGKLTLGPGIKTDEYPERFALGGDLDLIQLSAGAFETCEFRFFREVLWNGRVTVHGQGDLDFASRTNGIGITLWDAAFCTFTGGLRAINFWLWGVWCPSAGTNFDSVAHLGFVIATNCGSGLNVEGQAYSLAANWDTPVNHGGQGDPGQYTLINVDTLPDADIETYETPGSAQILVNIGGKYLRWVRAWDRTAGTLEIYPWLSADDISAGSGSLHYEIGGGIGTTGGDSGIINFDLNAFNCGRGMGIASLYGPRVNSAVIQGCGSDLVIGGQPDGACIGVSVDAYYNEGATSASVVVIPRMGGGTTFSIGSSYALDVSAIVTLGDALFDDGTLGVTGGSLGSDDGDHLSVGGTVAIKGENLHFVARNRTITNHNGAIGNFFDHAHMPYTKVHFVDTITIVPQVVSKVDEYNALFGLTGNRWVIVGSGPNNEPTGNVNFTCPTKAISSCVTLNGNVSVTMPSTLGLVAGMPISGAGIPANTTISSIVDSTTIHLSAAATASATVTLAVTGSLNGAYAGLVYNGFNGPVDFEIRHTDPYELVWRITPLSGWMPNGSKTFDPPSIAAAAATTTTIAVTGAAMGQRWVAAFSNDLQGIVLTAYVSAAGTVTCSFFNPTAGAIDLGSGTLSVARAR